MDVAIEALALQLSKRLTEMEWQVVTAESCTAGGLSYWITSIPGSSLWFERGFITYSNTAKMEMLAVDPGTLKNFGAVSEDTAREMALGALQNSQAQISIAITGIAGPDGGSKEKPVGTVWISLATREGEIKTELFQFEGDREKVRTHSIMQAMRLLIEFLK